MVPESFGAASEAAEAWLGTVAFVAYLGERAEALDAQGRECPIVDTAFRLLFGKQRSSLNKSYEKHSGVLEEVKEKLTPLSDGPINWGAGRGLSAIYTDRRIQLHAWSSAHEVALGVAELAFDLLVAPLADVTDPREQWTIGKQLLIDRWKALSIPRDELAALQERIRRERAKLLHLLPEPSAEAGSTPEEAPLLERVLDVLTEPQRKMVEYLWHRKSGAGFDAIINIPGAFRQGTSPSDETIKDKIKKVRERLQEHNVPVLLEMSGRRVKLVFPPG
jgi:hypothetical protein